jgi:hypothetical protein
MKVTETKASSDAITSRIDLELDAVPASARGEVKDRVGDLIIDAILSSVSKAQSPVAGESFPGLSKEYKAKKVAAGHPGKPNLEFDGDMLAALGFHSTEDGIEVGIFGNQAPKADGHNNFSGESNLPQRRFLPDVGQEFKSSIRSGVDKIVAEAISDNARIPRHELDSISTVSELYDLLSEYFGEASRSQIRAAVLNSPDLVDLLEGEGLLDLL